MTARVVIGDKSGVQIAELEGELGPVSWRLNDVGSVKFGLARTDGKATEEILQFGNRVLIEFDNGLPTWAGVLDPPREWKDGQVWSTGYSAEYLLGWRQTDRGRYFSDASVGYIFSQLVSEAQVAESLGIGLDKIYYGGEGHWPDYHFDNVLKVIRDSLVSRLSNFDWEVVGSLSGGRIVLTANLYERKGSLRTNVALIEGSNLTGIRLLEQGKIVNAWDVAGEGSTWGSDRLVSAAADTTSRSAYGLRQDASIFGGVSVQATLDSHASTLLAESKGPHNMLELSAADEEPFGFEAYDVGDSVRVQLTSFGFGGFDGMVRILGREYDAGTGMCKLVTRED